VGRDSLAYEASPQAVRPSPRHGQHDLGRMMPGFSVEGSFLIRSGIQELVLARHDDETAVRGQDATGLWSALAGRSWFRRGRL